MARLGRTPGPVPAVPPPAEGQWAGAAKALRWVTDSLAVVGDDPQGAIASLAGMLPVEPGVVTVIGEPAGRQAWELVAELVPVAVPPGVLTRLVVSGTGGSAGPAVAPAHDLARRIDSEVEAPLGRVTVVPGGTLFAPDGWRRFAPDGRVTTLGRRVPHPEWEDALDMLTGPAAPGLRVVPIPAGLWVTTDDPAAPADDLPFAVPMDTDRPVLLLGRPGYPPPDGEQLATLVDALYPDVVIAPYGSGSDVCLAVAEAAARRWGIPVEVATGLPALDHRGATVSVAVDPDGSGSWQPPFPRLRSFPTGPTRPFGEVEPLAGVPQTGPGTYRLNNRWVAEATPYGLWVRPPFAGSVAAQVRGAHTDPRRFTVRVGLPGAPLGDEVLPLLHALIARLPGGVRERLDVVPHEVAVALSVGTTTPQAPDVAIAPERAGAPRWWRPDPRFFTVLIEADRRTGLIQSDAGPVDGYDAGEIVAGQNGRAGRPVLLVANAPVAEPVQQDLADQVQAVVIGPDRSGWRVCRPRRAGITVVPPTVFDAAYPFPDPAVAAATLLPPVPALTPGFGDPGDAPLDLREMPNANVAYGHSTVAVTAGPGRRMPFVLHGRPVTAWELAEEIGVRRPTWLRRNRPVRLDVPHVDGPVLHLLANYLGTPVGIRMERLTADAVGDEDRGWLVVTARIPHHPQPAHPPRTDERTLP